MSRTTLGRAACSNVSDSGIVTKAYREFVVSIAQKAIPVPVSTPFLYNAGINYETWTLGRNSRIISADLDQITKYYRLIKTFHDAAVGTSDPSTPIIEPTQQSVIDYVVARPKLQLVMGTNNSALAQGGFGTPWRPGLMNSQAYTDKWVSMLIRAFGSADAVKTHLTTVLLGNEIDANGPPPTDVPNFNAYLNGWIPSALNNLKASMSAHWLGSIPVSTIIANYPSDPSANLVASKTTNFVTNDAYWCSAWNSGHPFLMFNQYTLDNGMDPDFGPVAAYFEKLGTNFNHKPDILVGETGFSAEFGSGVADEAKVLGEMFAWAGTPLAAGKITIPVFAFEAFDLPDKPPGQKLFGLFADHANNVPDGLKPGIVVPAWVLDPITP